jgi:N-methylhydantoinase A
VISFDMGGTTAKASLIRDGQPGMAEGYYVGGYASGDPVMAPVVDVVEVGAGGGSIAWIDEVGALKVGPQSAGAAPGPVCYGAGGVEPTITDANVILGRVGAADFLGGEMALDLDAARDATEENVGATLDMNPLETSRAIIEIAIAKMSLAVREISVEKGYDPRDFALVASGGAGPLHAVAIARDLHIPTVIIPRFPAHFSALGMLMADERHDFTRTHLSALDRLDFAQLRNIHGEMVRESERVLRETRDVTRQIYMDLRYVGQEFTLSVPVTEAQLDSGDIAAIRRDFDELHEQRYAHHAADEPLELVNLRMVVLGRRPRLQLPNVAIGTDATAGPVRRPVYFDDTATPVDCPVHRRETLAAGATIDGPALIQEYASTTVMFDGDTCVVAETGELIISVRSDT